MKYCFKCKSNEKRILELDKCVENYIHLTIDLEAENDDLIDKVEALKKSKKSLKDRYEKKIDKFINDLLEYIQHRDWKDIHDYLTNKKSELIK